MSIVVVGNSDVVLQQKKGREVNRFETVVRCNRAPLLTYADDVGWRTTDRFMNPHLAKGGEQGGQCELDLKDIQEERIHSVHDFEPEEFYAVFGSSNTFKRYQADWWKHQLQKHDIEINHTHNPSIGFDAICYYLDEKPTIYGFDLEEKRFDHYWRKEKRNSTYHKWGYEKRVLNQMLNNGLITQL